MNISIHFITSLVLTAVLWPFIGLYSLWAVVGGFLIDVDHYLYGVYKWRMWNLKESYHFHFTKEFRKTIRWGEILHIFHTIEFWIFMIAIAVISYLNSWVFTFYMFTITFIGMMLHFTLDAVDGIRKKEFSIRAISLIQWWQLMRRVKN